MERRSGSSPRRTRQVHPADLNGWQTGYAFDATLLGPQVAADDAPSRATFLTPTERFAVEADQIAAMVTGETIADVENVQALFEQYMDVDEQVVAGYGSRDRGRYTSTSRLTASGSPQ